MRGLGAAEAGEKERERELERSFHFLLKWCGDAQRGEDTEEDKSERGVMKINN